MGKEEGAKKVSGVEIQEKVSDKYTERDIYYYYVKEKARVNNRGFKFPKKPFDEFIKTKPAIQQTNLKKITERFNTAWCNIDPDMYFYCAFKIFGKNFYFTKFFEPAILTRYRREKLVEETSYEGAKERTKQSLVWISKYIRTSEEVNTIEDYFKKKTGYLPVFVSHYLKDKVNDLILAWVWMNEREWISSIDSDIQATYLRTFTKNVYKHISFLTENRDVYLIIHHVFSKLS